MPEVVRARVMDARSARGRLVDPSSPVSVVRVRPKPPVRREDEARVARTPTAQAPFTKILSQRRQQSYGSMLPILCIALLAKRDGLVYADPPRAARLSQRDGDASLSTPVLGTPPREPVARAPKYSECRRDSNALSTLRPQAEVKRSPLANGRGNNTES